MFRTHRLGGGGLLRQFWERVTSVTYFCFLPAPTANQALWNQTRPHNGGVEIHHPHSSGTGQTSKPALCGETSLSVRFVLHVLWAYRWIDENDLTLHKNIYYIIYNSKNFRCSRGETRVAVVKVLLQESSMEKG